MRDENSGNNKSFEFDFEVLYHDVELDLFCVIFKLMVLHEGDFTLDVQYGAWFKLDENITEEFKTSQFPSINAPAIAFPFLRSFISTLTLNAGFAPAILPSINFVAFNKSNKEG